MWTEIWVRVGALLMAAVLAMSSIAPLAEEEIGTEAVPMEAYTEVTTEADEGAFFEVTVPEDDAGETWSEEPVESYEYAEEPVQEEAADSAAEETVEETPAEESEEPEETEEETEPCLKEMNSLRFTRGIFTGSANIRTLRKRPGISLL